MMRSSSKSISYFNIFEIIGPVILMYCTFFTIRILNYQPAAEAELGDFITSVFFLFGASIVYMVFILKSIGFINHEKPLEKYWWLMSSLFLAHLAFDEIFMIHEHISDFFHMLDVFVFLVYGFILVVLVFFYRHKMSNFFKLFLGLFIILSGIAVVSDTFFGEGMITIMGRSCDFEQLAESVSALALSAAFVAAVIRELTIHFKPGK